ncbi:MAG: ABC transporter ATP-binding protein [Spirochaetia bacterium]|nr:ABC transporter ATP-binding protein [Spirochaetota bacterium]MCX8096054.1 ABC transporter ATP-binding protein [Spirochaetota bacterium]MDW8113240.1 ABC transporter ATP-binding protein [Spirochaetia bacterium]
MVIVEVKNLYKSYPNVVALKNVSVSINRGECVGFLGPNGAGKTTLVKAIIGLVKVDRGDITVMGLPVKTRLKEIKRYIGVAPQENSLDGDVSVLDNLILFGELFGISTNVLKERAIKLLEELEMIEKINEEVEHLSGGMKRKLMIARALINDPDIVILDEPTVGLDPEIRKNIWDKIVSLKERGKTIILTTHYLDEAQSLCDRIFIMNRGEIIESGDPETLIKKYLPKYTVEIYPKVNIPEKIQNIKKIEFENHLLIFTDTPSDVKSLFGDKDIRKFNIRNSNLEDLFFILTGKGFDNDLDKSNSGELWNG